MFEPLADLGERPYQVSCPHERVRLRTWLPTRHKQVRTRVQVALVFRKVAPNSDPVPELLGGRRVPTPLPLRAQLGSKRSLLSDKLARRQTAAWDVSGGVTKPGLGDDGVVVVAEDGLDSCHRIGKP